MTIETQSTSNDAQLAEPQLTPSHRRQRINPTALKALFILVGFILGLGSGYLMGRQSMSTDSSSADAHTKNKGMAMIRQINPPEGYTIPATFGNIGPQMLDAGAIDLNQFIQTYQQAGKPLTAEQMAILTEGSSSQIVINAENSYFLLNFFWAFGLTNLNRILTEGPMAAKGKDQIGNFASTGGWTIGAKQPTALYASTLMVPMTMEQQDRLMEVATAVYRPCCDNPTHFPDCNHGMAMLGLLELMASQNASVEEMFDAAKYVNAFWYPQQMLEITTYFDANDNVNFAEADSRQVVSRQYSSSSGFQAVHQWLAANGQLEQIPNRGGGCGV
jgi:hypothetical protein